MEKLIRAVAAYWGARKMSGGRCGCLTVVLFVILYWLLGYVFALF